jgi:hypothetical protein
MRASSIGSKPILGDAPQTMAIEMGLKTKRIGIISGLLVLMLIPVTSVSAQPPIPTPPLPPYFSDLTVTPSELARAIHNHIIIENNMESWNKWNIVPLPTKRVKAGTNISIFPNYLTLHPRARIKRRLSRHMIGEGIVQQFRARAQWICGILGQEVCDEVRF